MLNLEASLKGKLIENFPQIVPILRALANETRFLILIILWDGPKSFQSLLISSGLQKTALSNHLARLLQSKLIDKPDYGRYTLSMDGKAYLRCIYDTWQQSLSVQEQKFHTEQIQSISSQFLNSFFKR